MRASCERCGSTKFTFIDYIIESFHLGIRLECVTCENIHVLWAQKDDIKIKW